MHDTEYFSKPDHLCVIIFLRQQPSQVTLHVKCLLMVKQATRRSKTGPQADDLTLIAPEV